VVLGGAHRTCIAHSPVTFLTTRRRRAATISRWGKYLRS